MQKVGLYKRTFSSSLCLCLSAGRRAVCNVQVSGEDIFERNVGCGAFAAPRGKEVQQGAVNHSCSGGGMENETEM